MRCIWPLLLAACSGTLAPPPSSSPPSDPQGPPALRVMTFNIRYGTAADGANAWPHRRELCASRIRAADPDVLGVQEALAIQNEYLLASCPGYEALGVGRDDGVAKGEFSTLFVRRARFRVLASGTFWYGDTPDVVGTKSLDAALPRIATWARLVDRRAGERPLLVVNTHFDHRGERARAAAAVQLRAFLARHAEGAAVVVLGDFNTTPGSEPHRVLLGSGDDGVALYDSLRAALGKPVGDEGTFHGFAPRSDGRRIDWILHTAPLGAIAATIDRTRDGARFPSDHDPVVVTLRWGPH